MQFHKVKKKRKSVTAEWQIYFHSGKNPGFFHQKLLRPWTVSVLALTKCFIIACGEKAAYQRAACDGVYHSIEDIDRKAQQCRPTVNYSFIHVILKEREWRAAFWFFSLFNKLLWKTLKKKNLKNEEVLSQAEKPDHTPLRWCIYVV